MRERIVAEFIKFDFSLATTHLCTLALYCWNSTFSLDKCDRFLFKSSLNLPNCWHNICHWLFFPSEDIRCGLSRVHLKKFSPCLFWLNTTTLTSTAPICRGKPLCWLQLDLLYCSEAMVHPRLWNGEKNRLDCRWTPTNTPSKLSHNYVCSQLWDIHLSISVSYTSNHSKSEPRSHVICLLLPWSISKKTFLIYSINIRYYFLLVF